MLLPLLILGLQATAGLPAAEGISSGNFSIARPYVRARGDKIAVSGTVCRRANFYGLSPPRLQIEAVGPDGAVVARSHAFLAELSRRADQRCGHYGTLIKAQGENVTRVRVCAAHHGDCRARGAD